MRRTQGSPLTLALSPGEHFADFIAKTEVKAVPSLKKKYKLAEVIAK
jgi:hypothetical protein